MKEEEPYEDRCGHVFPNALPSSQQGFQFLTINIASHRSQIDVIK